MRVVYCGYWLLNNKLIMIISSAILLLCVFSSSLLTMKVANKYFPLVLHTAGRNIEIDGLRGFLALGVVTHHSSIWYMKLTTGEWSLPTDNILINLGQASVTYFFMITGFLFFSKIRKSQVNYLRMYVNRIFRLTPVFVVAIGIAFFVVALKTGFTFKEPILTVMTQIFRWIPFTALGTVDINSLKDTYIITAGVTWTLVYEWFFYFSLPLLALILGRKPSPAWLLLSIIAIIAFLFYPLNKTNILSFAFGFLASYAREYSKICVFAKTKFASMACAILIVFELVYFTGTYAVVPIITCGIVFIMIASGCDLFGMLKLKISRELGEATYSIYLLHGLVLYLFLGHFSNTPSSIGDYHYLSLVFISASLITIISLLSYRFIEIPFIRK